MKKLTLTLAMILITLFLTAQFGEPCLPEGVTFTTQAEIDSFQINHPNCTEIEGSVFINGGNRITNLNGLNVITSIVDSLFIGWSDSLINLSGLDNITSIGGSLELISNAELTSLTGLEKCLIIGGDLIIGVYHFWGGYLGNPKLKSLSAFEKLGSIGGTVEIVGNYELKNLKGLDSICVIGSNLVIGGNLSLTSLTGLENLTVIDSNLFIGVKVINSGGNKSLKDLTGLNNLKLIRGDLRIIDEDSLENFNGLDSLNTIEGNLIVGDQLYNAGDNPSLTNFQGLEKLDSIGGALIIYNNPALQNLIGLDNLKTLRGGATIEKNNSLVNISALNSLQYVFGSLKVEENNAITSLSGLNNINGDSLDYLIIKKNQSLSDCAVQSICDFLSSHSWGGTIWDNDTGCISREEVEQACKTVSVGEVSISDKFTTSPNPFSTLTTIAYKLQHPTIIQITILNHLGKQIELNQQTQSAGNQQFIWNAEDLPSGMYFCVLKTDFGTQTMKMIKLK